MNKIKHIGDFETAAAWCCFSLIRVLLRPFEQEGKTGNDNFCVTLCRVHARCITIVFSLSIHLTFSERDRRIYLWLYQRMLPFGHFFFVYVPCLLRSSELTIVICKVPQFASVDHG